jgi:signal transduction histidine kinase
LFIGAALVLLRGIGLWPGDGIMWLATNAAIGSALLSIRTSPEDRARWSGILASEGDGRPLWRWVRGIVGGALVIVGVGGILFGRVSISAIGDVGLAIGVTVAAAGIVLGPWLTRVVRDLGAERRERVRAEERERIAAHLHDSVLQTFALMQRAGDDPRRMATLARRQERELRAWLYEGRDLTDASAVDLRSALELVAHDIEGLHDLRVDTVIVGDTGLDERTSQLVAAVREALTNVGKHAQADDVSLYVEVTDRALSAYVRDRGVGFDPSDVNGDARGIADSIVGRLRRLGGSAEVHSAPGDGTEIVMEIPR